MAKAISSTDPSTSDTITRVLPHAFSLLPHCNASSSKTRPGRRNKVPTGSNCMIRCFKDSPSCCLGGGLDGRTSSSTRIARPPMGALIQKHHRQVTFVVNAPPSKGPAIEARPKLAPMVPWYFGRLCKGTKSTKMMIAPAVVPAVPIPAMARPIIKAVDVGAAAQTIEPISKTTIVAMKVVLVAKKVCRPVGHAQSLR